ncbi:MAG TPA: peptidylprolyl isomerase [Pyrinomonadaceae bacterium]|nr:peptidylprolyl isomerase [Pyrinomonadaceae bacterium]
MKVVSLKIFSRARRAGLALAALALAVASSQAVLAQEEGVAVVVDEVIAQVNNDVVTLSMVRREMRQAVRALMDSRGMSEADATAEVEKNRARIIASLIDEQLLMQKGKEIPRLTEEVEAEVNRTLLAEGKRQGLTTMEQLEAAMQASKLNPSEIRASLRAQFTRQAVLQREVDARIYFGLTDDELQKYFAANREKFRKPESVEISEIYLSLAGKPVAEVRARAAQLVAQARGGADFGQLAATHSEREANGVRISAQSKGKIGRFEVPDLRPDLAAALKNVQKGGVTDPIQTDDGIQILRVDDRAGSAEPVFNEQAVRGAMTEERAQKEREDYLVKARNDAYVSVAESYRDLVLPVLKLKPPVSANKDAEKEDKKDKKKKN